MANFEKLINSVYQLLKLDPPENSREKIIFDRENKPPSPEPEPEEEKEQEPEQVVEDESAETDQQDDAEVEQNSDEKEGHIDATEQVQDALSEAEGSRLLNEVFGPIKSSRNSKNSSAKIL